MDPSLQYYWTKIVAKNWTKIQTENSLYLSHWFFSGLQKISETIGGSDIKYFSSVQPAGFLSVVLHQSWLSTTDSQYPRVTSATLIQLYCSVISQYIALLCPKNLDQPWTGSNMIFEKRDRTDTLTIIETNKQLCLNRLKAKLIYFSLQLFI